MAAVGALPGERKGLLGERKVLKFHDDAYERERIANAYKLEDVHNELRSAIAQHDITKQKLKEKVAAYFLLDERLKRICDIVENKDQE